MNGVPIVTVTFPNGHEDTLILDRHYSLEEDRIKQVEACNYIGHLEKDTDACVAMTGCIGLEDVEFTIMSEHATESPMFKWTKEDNVEIIKHPYLVKNKHLKQNFVAKLPISLLTFFKSCNLERNQAKQFLGATII